MVIQKNRAGQSLVDILVGLALITIAVSFTLILVFGGQSILIDRENAGGAKNLAKDGIQAANLIVKENWSGISDGVYGLVFSTTTNQWEFSSSSDSTIIYTRTVTITTLNNNEKSVSSTVAWEAAPGRILTIEFVTLITNWSEVERSGGDTGGTDPEGDWRNPRTLGSVDLGPGNSATDLDTKDKIIYMSAEASAVAKPDFFIIDATNGEMPVIKSSIDIDTKGLNSVDVADSYVYAANQSSKAQLVVIDVSNINSPFVVTTSSLPGVTQNDTYGRVVFYYDSKVYIGSDEDSNGAEFHVFDVSNPTSPVHINSFEIGADVNDIFIKNDKAYVATDLSGAGLMILDVSNPASIVLLGQAYGERVSVYNSNDSLTLLGSETTFYTVDTTNPNSITGLGDYSPGGSVNDIATRSYLAFIGTSDSNNEFQIINISTTTSPQLYSSFNFPQVATGIDYENNLVYVAVRSNDALRIITSTP